MPVAGSYRSIDFTLSNMSNSHIQKVAVLTQYNARSLNEHLSSSKWWDFGRKQGGLFVLTPTVTADNSNWYRGTADAIYQNLTFLKNSHEPYVVIASGDGVYKLDFNKVLEYHIDKKADITVVCRDMEPGTNVERFGTVRMNEESRIEEFEEKPLQAKTNTISCGIYVVRRRQLIDMVNARQNIKAMKKISIQSLPAIIVASHRRVIPTYSDLGPLCVHVIGPEMQRLGCKCPPPGYCFTIEHGKEYTPTDIDIEYCEQVEEMGTDSALIQFKQLPEVPTALCMKHYGPYERFYDSFVEVFSYIDEHNYRITGHPRTVYVDGAWNQEDPEKWLSIIQVPVATMEDE